MNERTMITAGLDVGSAYVRCLAGVLEDDTVRLLGYGEAPSEGFVKGRLADPHAASQAILRAVRGAETTSMIAIESAVVGMGGAAVRGANSRGPFNLGPRPREIEQEDIRRATRIASKVVLPEEQMILQICLQDFVVDDHPGHRDPRRMVASHLEANVHVITALTQEHDAMLTAVNGAHLSVEETIFEPMAACYAAVRPEERREGLALIDLGAHSTDMVVYYGDALQLAASLPICGDHFTRDIAHRLGTTFEDAQRLKEEYGSAIAGGADDSSIIEVPSAEGRDPREAPRRVLNEVLEARATELFRLVRRELLRVGMEDAIMGGVVLTGGGARMNQIHDVADRMLVCQSRTGFTDGVRDLPEFLKSPEWTAAAGLMLYSAKLKLRAGAERSQSGVIGRMFR